MTTAAVGDVRVDWESIRPFAERTGRAEVAFRPRAPWPDDAGVRELLAAVDRACLRAEVPEVIDVFQVFPSPDGPLLLVEDGEVDEKRAWLGDVAAGLASAGWSGVLRLAPQVEPPAWTVGSAWRLAAFAGYTLAERVPDPRSPDWRVTWGVGDAATEEICRHAATWTEALPGGEVYLDHAWFTVPLAGHDVAREVRVGLDWSAKAAVLSCGEEPERARRAAMNAWGQAVYVVADETAGWRGEVEALLEILREPPAAVDLAFVRRAPGWSGSWISLDSVRPPLPYVGESDVRLNRRHWAERVPDAHGVQLLTDAHLARTRDLSRWDVRPVGRGRHLVQARDLEPWFAGDEADPAVVAAAREDFGDALRWPSWRGGSVNS